MKETYTYKIIDCTSMIYTEEKTVTVSEEQQDGRKIIR
jgi:hypothetical protein